MTNTPKTKNPFNRSPLLYAAIPVLLVGLVLYFLVHSLLGLAVIWVGVLLQIAGGVHTYKLNKRADNDTSSPTVQATAASPASKPAPAVSVTPAQQKVIAELKAEGLSDEEVIWYAVNMHDFTERQAHDALSAEVPSSAPLDSPAPASTAKDPASALSQPALPANNGYRIALSGLLLAATVSALASLLLVMPQASSEERPLLGSILITVAAVSFLIWIMQQQASQALPGKRWLCATRPLVIVTLVLIIQWLWSVFYEYDVSGDSRAILTLGNLLMMQAVFMLRHWVSWATLAPFAIAYSVLIGIVLRLIHQVFYTAVENISLHLSWSEIFLSMFINSDWQFLFIDIANSAMLVGVMWAMFRFMGQTREPAPLPSGWPLRLWRGEFGLPRSFWYLGVLGGIPFSILLQFAVLHNSSALGFPALLGGILFWVLVGSVIWRAGAAYGRKRVWFILACVAVVWQCLSFLYTLITAL